MDARTDPLRTPRAAGPAARCYCQGLQLVETGGGNFRLADYPGLIVKDSYWRWPERALAGNATADNRGLIVRWAPGNTFTTPVPSRTMPRTHWYATQTAMRLASIGLKCER